MIKITDVEIERVRKAVNEGWKAFPIFESQWGFIDEEGEHK